MKKITLLLVLSTINLSGFSQTNILPTTGNVGIGITNPAAPLHILKQSIPETSVVLQQWSPVVAGYDLSLALHNSVSGIDYRFTQYHAGTPVPVLTFRAGNVGIGTINPWAKLSVDGLIMAKEIRVDITAFPDYVFEDDYPLRPLSDLKKYIKKNKHLPEIPTEKEVSKNGVGLGEFNKLLLKKIEELTLYLIQQKEDFEKKNILQDLQINELKRQIEAK